MNGARVVLASQSPRRRQLLSLIGIPHEVRPADIDETFGSDEQPVPHCERLAREKALTIARQDPEAIVIAADTIVVLDGEVLGKPADEAEAREILARLSGRTHTVHTALAVARGPVIRAAVESVQVTFRELSPENIARYVATGEPMDKAGAYGIQGFGATIVRRIDGDYFAVMGLALGRLVELLGEVGVTYQVGVGLHVPPTVHAPETTRAPSGSQ
ncbi:MAG: septum formation inhibitor Maf [Gemmatimonadetes bacterium]|nr:septum formation inhibitor Maf [Gemmatimonadota bacterium]